MRHIFRSSFLRLLVMTLWPAASLAQTTPEAALRALLTGPVSQAQFAESFLQAVPMPQITAILDDLRNQVGPPDVVTVTAGQFEVETESHILIGQIALDAEGRITGLFFQPPEPRVSDLAEAVAALDALPGETAWLVMRDGEVLAEQGADDALAVGSAFKIGVLQVLAEDIAAGARDWADVLRLEARHKSLPSGQLQDFPDGAPLTLHTAAALMIAISDNTATDLLIDALGAERIAAALGIEHLLTTRAFFALKADPEAGDAYLSAEPGARDAIAARAAETLPQVAQLPHYREGIEWHVPLRRLCAVMEAVAELDVMQINPGVARPDRWQSAAYKGGSEPGVMNLTSSVTDAQGRQHCVALTVNHAQALDEAAILSAYRAVLGALNATP